MARPESRVHRFAFLAAAVALACTVPLDAAGSGDVEAPRALILISIDGFRWDYPDLYDAPHLEQLGREGVRAAGLIPPFPTKTFPSHYTLITGLWAENHGIVGNDMFDPEFDAVFHFGERDAMRDGRWWGGEPLWVTAERQGLRSAVLFWVGSEASINGVRPSIFTPYNSGLPDYERVDQALAWLDLDVEQRPSLITLYFSRVDGAGHTYGPKSKEVAQAVREVDRNLGRLFDGIERRGLEDRVDIVIVSDHGMAALDHERVIVLEDHVDLTGEEVISLSPVLGVWPKQARAKDLVRTLDAVPHLRAWAREDLPERFHWKDHRRIPPVVALADEGWRITRRAGLERLLEANPGGTHGFDNKNRSMHGIFFAAGPSFRRGLQPPAFDSVHIYALLAEILGLDAAPGDGNLTVLKPLLNTRRR